MNDVKWIKIAIDVFDNRKIKQIEAMPDGDAIVVIWFKILCLAGKINDMGIVRFSEEIPYTEQLLATEFNKPLQTVQLALGVFQKFEMIEVIDDVIKVSNWERYQNIEGMERAKILHRERQKRYRERISENVTSHCVTRDVAVTLLDIDKDIEREKDNNTPLYPPTGESEGGKSKKSQKRFTPPTAEEVREYCLERGNGISGEEFVDFYESKGWMVGSSKMKDWKAAVRTWESKRGFKYVKRKEKKQNDMREHYNPDLLFENDKRLSEGWDITDDGYWIPPKV